MNTTTFTNSDGTIITITKIHATIRHGMEPRTMILLAIVGLVCIAAGLWMFRKPLPK